MSVTGWGGVTLTIEAAFSSSTGSYGAWNVGLWDTATWGPDVVWTDITIYVRSFTTDRGFSPATNRWQTGTASIELSNSDGRFSPANTSGPYVSGGVTGIRPWRPVRIRATWNSVTYSLFTGYSLSFDESYPGYTDNVVTMQCVDEQGRLAAFDAFAQASQGAGETSGARIQRILNNTGNTAPRSVANGTATMQATMLAQPAITDLDLTADSEGGWLWVDADGTIVFDDRFSPIEITRMNTSQATIAESSYVDLELAYDGLDLVNMAAIARAGGTQQTASDATSRALYGDRQYSRNDLLCESDAVCKSLADVLVLRKKDPKLRITSAVIRPIGNPSTLWPQVLGRMIRDRVLVQRTPAAGYAISQTSQIERVSHTVVDATQWQTTFGFSDYSAWASFTSARWDTAVWDTATWFY